MGFLGLSLNGVTFFNASSLLDASVKFLDVPALLEVAGKLIITGKRKIVSR